IGIWDRSLIDSTSVCSAEYYANYGLRPDHPKRSMEEWRQSVHHDDRDRAMQELQDAMNAPAPCSSEYRVVWPDESIHWQRVIGKVFHNDAGMPVRMLGVNFDFTERKRAEEEVRQLQESLAHVTRISVMGEMATGLAHELNQPLAAISTFCHVGQALAETESADLEKLRELFEKSERQAIRAGEIIRRLRVLVGKRDSVRSPVDVIEVIEEVLHLLETDLRQSEVEIDQNQQTNHSDDVVIIDEIEIQQVLVNLIRNASDAMSAMDRGQRTLKITTAQTADDLIEIAVCDAGNGVPPEQQDQIFDAFFTTKSSGMGMGLAISRTIIESHGGRLWMTPNSGRGVTFHLTLPIAKECSDDDGR
ncbi:MAG: PAS domain-containing protein, partial [Planctomycetaceae bacterium]|nr:PAS domain-containing protein [Planctomycetaceae bacterium]